MVCPLRAEHSGDGAAAVQFLSGVVSGHGRHFMKSELADGSNIKDESAKADTSK